MDDGLTQNASRVGEVANLAHVSVRTLHHYDAIGLVRPSGRSEAGYRLYTAEDLERLQTVLLFKELGFGLGEIRDLLAEPGYDRREALRATPPTRAPVCPHRRHARPRRQDAGRDGRRDTYGTR
jgi:DNA-binding transcriptional MerR regulator